MKTYIVIPHFILDETVAELARQTIQSFKKTCPDCIIVSCDDESPYDTSFLKDISDVYIRNEHNLGFAGNCNVGFNYVFDNEPDECYIVCANNDIIVYGDWLGKAKECFEQNNADMVGGLGYQHTVVEGMPIENYQTNVGSLYNSRCKSEGGRFRDWMFPGGFYITKKSVLQKFGIYDDGFKHGGYEDIDLFYRIKQGGGKLIMTSQIWYWHKEGATRFSESQKGTQNWAEPLNREYFKTKNGFYAHQKINQFLTDNPINP